MSNYPFGTIFCSYTKTHVSVPVSGYGTYCSRSWKLESLKLTWTQSYFLTLFFLYLVFIDFSILPIVRHQYHWVHSFLTFYWTCLKNHILSWGYALGKETIWPVRHYSEEKWGTDGRGEIMIIIVGRRNVLCQTRTRKWSWVRCWWRNISGIIWPVHFLWSFLHTCFFSLSWCLVLLHWCLYLVHL